MEFRRVLFRSVAADRQLVGRGPVFLRVAIVPLSGRGHLSGPGRLTVRWARSSVHLAGAGFCQSHGAERTEGSRRVGLVRTLEPASARWHARLLCPALLGQAAAGTHHAGRAERQSLHRSEEHTSELQSLMRISYAVFCLKKKKNNTHI